MTSPAVTISPQESVQVAARQLTYYNVGALPVCGADGKIQGMVTDRDLVIRCMAANRDPAKTTVKEVMTGRVLAAPGQMDIQEAARLMGKEQIRRLPVVEKGRVCGMLTLGDLAACGAYAQETANALGDISNNVSNRCE